MKYFAFSLLALLVSCKQPKETNIDMYICHEISNAELKKEIIKYDTYIKKKMQKRPYLLQVDFLSLNDSVDRYVVYYRPEIIHMNRYPFDFMCKAGGKYVLFNHVNRNGYRDWDHPTFKLSKKAHLEIMKQCFPDDYRRYIKPIQECREICYMPECFFLTFYKGKLVSKTIGGGSYIRKIPYRVNGKDFYD